MKSPARKNVKIKNTVFYVWHPKRNSVPAMPIASKHLTNPVYAVRLLPQISSRSRPHPGTLATAVAEALEAGKSARMTIRKKVMSDEQCLAALKRARRKLEAVVEQVLNELGTHPPN